MFIQILIAGILLVTLINLILNLRYLKTPDINSKIPDNPSMVSILVPARNEEENIEACLESLCRQDYPNYEILVLDDNSTDSTAAVVQQLANRDRRLRLIRGAPLAEGWSGKNYACFQLAKEARGDWLLFVDADTIHAPSMLRGVLALAMEQKTSLLSGFPRQVAETLPLKIFTPTWYFIIMTWCPLWWLQWPGHSRPSIAIGQFLLFSKNEYWRIGGHEAVKSKVLEDIWLGIEMGKHRGKHIAVDLSNVVSCRMYNDFHGIWKGLGRSVYAVAEISVAALVMLMVFAYFCYLLPFYSLPHELLSSHSNHYITAIVIVHVSTIMLMRWLSDKRFNNDSIISIILHPVGILFLFMIVITAIFHKIAGTGITWKERVYTGESSAEEQIAESDVHKII
jgi:chlorobactene glucosyltransferase